MTADKHLFTVNMLNYNSFCFPKNVFIMLVWVFSPFPEKGINVSIYYFLCKIINKETFKKSWRFVHRTCSSSCQNVLKILQLKCIYLNYLCIYYHDYKFWQLYNYQSNTLHYWVEVNAHLYTLVNANCHNEQNNYFTAGKGMGI